MAPPFGFDALLFCPQPATPKSAAPQAEVKNARLECMFMSFSSRISLGRKLQRRKRKIQKKLSASKSLLRPFHGHLPRTRRREVDLPRYRLFFRLRGQW